MKAGETHRTDRSGARWLLLPALLALAWFGGYVVIQLHDLPTILFPITVGLAAAVGVRYATGGASPRSFTVGSWALAVIGSMTGWWVAERLSIWVEEHWKYDWGLPFLIIVAALVAGLAVGGLILGDRLSARLRR